MMPLEQVDDPSRMLALACQVLPLRRRKDSFGDTSLEVAFAIGSLGMDLSFCDPPGN